jgi:hypothetical protein
MDRIQGTDRWKARRLGKATASRIYDIVATKRDGKPTAARENYLRQLAEERVTGEPAKAYITQAMADGTRKEPHARTLYSLVTDRDVGEIEFIDHPTIANSGASPDGLILAERKFLEIKCPLLSTFLAYRESKDITPAHLCQIGWQFACQPEMETCDYVVYSDEVGYDERMFIRTVKRNDKFVAELERQVGQFLEEVDAAATALAADRD